MSEGLISLLGALAIVAVGFGIYLHYHLQCNLCVFFN